jgi:hypothetical protein
MWRLAGGKICRRRKKITFYALEYFWDKVAFGKCHVGAIAEWQHFEASVIYICSP